MTANQEAAIHGATRPVERAPVFNTVRLMIDRIVADDTTGELGAKDEIKLTAVVAVGEVTSAGARPTVRAKARRGRTIDAGQFKKGEVRNFATPKLIAEFPLGPRQGDWPRHFAQTTLLLAEIDENHLNKVVTDVIEAIDQDLGRVLAGAAAGLATTVAAAALAGGAAGSVVPLIGTAVGAAVTSVSALAFGAIKNARQDDLFPPKPVELKLSAYPQRAGKMDGAGGTARFQTKGGDYRVIYSWEIA